LIGTVMVWLLGGGLIGFILVWLVAAITEGLSMWWLALGVWRRMDLGEPLIGPWRGIWREREGLRRFILITNFDLTLRELAPNLAPLTVGWLLGPAAAGLLALAQRATALLHQPAVLLSQASYSVLAEQVARREYSALRHTVWRSAGLALLIAAPIVAVLAFAGGSLLSAIGGKSFGGGTTLVVLFALSRLVALGATPIAAGLTALGHPQRSMMVALVTNLAMYPLLPLLLHLIGIDGAGWHALVQNGVALAVLVAFFVRDARIAD
jgi:O-antigen/teichoic acid export membrane protein